MTDSKPFDTMFDFLKIGAFGRRKKRGRDKRYPSFNRRMMAATLDSLILIFLAPFFNRVVPIRTESLQKYAFDQNDPQSLHNFVIYALNDQEFITSWTNNLMAQGLVICIISAIFWHFWAATPGKMLLRMKIIDAKTEKPISDLQIILRASSYMISGMFFMMGFFWIAIDKKGRGWHDFLAETIVISVPWKQKKEMSPPHKTLETAETIETPSP